MDKSIYKTYTGEYTGSLTLNTPTELVVATNKTYIGEYTGSFALIKPAEIIPSIQILTSKGTISINNDGNVDIPPGVDVSEGAVVFWSAISNHAPASDNIIANLMTKIIDMSMKINALETGDGSAPVPTDCLSVSTSDREALARAMSIVQEK